MSKERDWVNNMVQAANVREHEKSKRLPGKLAHIARTKYMNKYGEQTSAEDVSHKTPMEKKEGPWGGWVEKTRIRAAEDRAYIRQQNIFAGRKRPAPAAGRNKQVWILPKVN